MASVEEVMVWLKSNYEHINTDLPGSVGEIAQNCSIEFELPNGRKQWVLMSVSIFRLDVYSPFAERSAHFRGGSIDPSLITILRV
jgi:hypothetical protein